MLKRHLNFDIAAGRTFFLWGQRQVGKSTLIRELYPNGLYIDLLRSDEFAAYSKEPHRLREILTASPPTGHVVLDEVQKVPALLDEVHWLIENKRIAFALCGSSARKLRRGHANLLGGRALRFELFGLVSREMGEQFELTTALNRGYLPSIYFSDLYVEDLRSYVGDYLKEEIAAEGLVRSLPTFARFLDAAALSDTDIVSYSTFARDCGVSSHTIQEYYQILVDTLTGSFLPAYSKATKRRIAKSPKFYFHDVGVVNHLARRGKIEPASFNFGKAFENWVFHELNTYNHYSRTFFELSYWQLSKVTEVDFIIGAMDIAIEAKATSRITADHLAGLRSLATEFKNVRRKIIVCCESVKRMTDDGILILPWRDFATMLWDGELTG